MGITGEATRPCGLESAGAHRVDRRPRGQPLKLPGFGEMKVKILVAVLAKKFGVKPRGWEKHAAHWHTVADVDSVESMAHAREIKRDMKAKAKAK